jgi:hypothetical protein
MNSLDSVVGEALGLTDARLRRVVGSEGFLLDYVSYATELTDAPTEFQIVGGLVALAVAAGNRVYFDQWGGRIFPNLWIVLISPSGWFRKSTAMNISKRLLIDAGLGEHIYPSQWSREALLDLVASRPAGLLSHGEFGSFLAMLGRDYMAGAKEDLTELFDSPPLYERKLRGGNGSAKIQYPAISLLAGTVIDWLTGRIREGDVRGGFLARFLFVTATKKTRWLGLTPAADAQRKNALVRHLAAVAKLSGAVELEPIRRPFEDWLKRHEAEEPDPNLTGFYARLGTYALKIAVLLELAAPTPSLTLSTTSWERAAAMMEYLRQHVTRLVQDQVTASPYQAKRAAVLQQIRKRKGLLHGELLAATKLPMRELEDILKALQADGSIETTTTEPGPKGGRPGRRYYPRAGDE